MTPPKVPLPDGLDASLVIDEAAVVQLIECKRDSSVRIYVDGECRLLVKRCNRTERIHDLSSGKTEWQKPEGYTLTRRDSAPADKPSAVPALPSGTSVAGAQ